LKTIVRRRRKDFFPGKMIQLLLELSAVLPSQKKHPFSLFIPSFLCQAGFVVYFFPVLTVLPSVM